MKSLKCKNRYQFFCHFRYLQLKLLNKRENNNCDIFNHNLKNVSCYNEKLLKRFYFALFDDGLTLKTLALAYIGFCIQTLYIQSNHIIGNLYTIEDVE